MQKLLASILHLNAQLEAKLSAAKVDDLVSANPQLEAEIRSLNDKDPSSTKKYLSWGVKQLLRGEDPEAIASVVTDFNDNVAKLDVKDINRFESLSSLKDKLSKLAPSKKQTAKQAKGGVTVLLEDDRWLLVRPQTIEASCFYGKGAKWCISSRMAERYYNDYSASNTFFYFLIDKKAESRSQFSKIAVSMIKNKEAFVVLWDAKNNVVDDDVVASHLEENGLSYDAVLHLCRTDCNSQPDTWQYQLIHARGKEMDRLFFEHYPFKAETTLGILATRTTTTPAILAELAKSGDRWVQLSVANNPSAPEHVLKELMEADDMDVKMHATLGFMTKKQQALSARRVKTT